MKQRIDTINKKISSVLGKREEWISERTKKKEELAHTFGELRTGKAALKIAIDVGELVQAQVSSRLSSIASYALESIWEDLYVVKIPFSSSGRGNIEAQILFSRNEEDFRPILPSGQLLAGGGPVEIAAFGLRCGLWAQMSSKETRPIFFLDEPFRFIQKDLQAVVAEMLRTLSEKIGLQIILVTHEPEIAESANNIINIGEKHDNNSSDNRNSSETDSFKRVLRKRNKRSSRDPDYDAGSLESKARNVKRTK